MSTMANASDSFVYDLELVRLAKEQLVQAKGPLVVLRGTVCTQSRVPAGVTHPPSILYEGSVYFGTVVTDTSVMVCAGRSYGDVSWCITEPMGSKKFKQVGSPFRFCSKTGGQGQAQSEFSMTKCEFNMSRIAGY